MHKKILVVAGTRPEAIKMAPIVKAFRRLGKDVPVEVKLCLTAQHRQMLDQVMQIFSLKPDFDLNVMAANQSLGDVTCKVLKGMEGVYAAWRPDLVLVQGDTTTVMAAALAAFYARIDVGHVEAGLRTGDIFAPWPEEMNRLLAGNLATLHFAPTVCAKENLLKENKDPTKVFVTGNTVIDALHDALRIIDGDTTLSAGFEQRFAFLDRSRRMILVTGHRRENFGQGFENICMAIASIAKRDDVQIVYPMHMNPHVREPVTRHLKSLPNVSLIEPLDYLSFLYLMRRAHLIMTDSGGVQEEAPSLGKPVVVMRNTTERPEAVVAGTVVLAGAETDALVSAVARLLDSDEAYSKMSRAINPYGDGKAAERIAGISCGLDHDEWHG